MGLILYLHSILIELTINSKIWCFDNLNRCSAKQIAPWLLIKIVALLICEFVWDKIIFKTITISYDLLK